MDEIQETIRVLAKPILAANPRDPVWVGKCCGRLTVICTADPPKICGRCKNPVEVQRVTEADLEKKIIFRSHDSNA